MGAKGHHVRAERLAAQVLPLGRLDATNASTIHVCIVFLYRSRINMKMVMG